MFVMSTEFLNYFVLGLFNIGNRLLVSIDLFLRIRANIKLGHTPGHCVRTLLDHLPSHPSKNLQKYFL